MLNKVVNLDDALESLRLNKTEDALKIFHEILKSDSKNLSVMTHISNIYSARKDTDKYNIYLKKKIFIFMYLKVPPRKMDHLLVLEWLHR